MPSTLLPFADSEIRMRYREPFLTEGLDIKLAINTPPGVYRGFRLGLAGVNMSVQVNADPVGVDHSAVYQTGTGRSLTLWKTGGNFTLGLTAYASKTVVLAIAAAYTLGSDTTAEIRAYELLPADEFTGAPERPELVVLGTVVVPASGIIAATSISHDRRTMSWETVAPEARTWSPLLRNSSFETSETAATHLRATRFWGGTVSPGAGGTFAPVTTDANTGLKSLQFSYVSGTPTGVFTQPVNLPVTPGQLLRAQVFVRAQQALTAGTAALAFTWRDGTGTVVATSTISIPVTGVDGSYRKIESTFPVPSAPAGILTLAEVQIVLTAVSFAGAGAAIRFDDVQVYAESQSVTGQFLFHERGRAFEVVQDLLFEDQAVWTQDALALRFANGTGLIGERKDQSASSVVQPLLDWRGRVLLGNNLLDTEAKALQPRITAPVSTTGGVDFTLMWQSVPTGQPGYRRYVSASGAVIETVNASWDGANWNKDTAGVIALKRLLSSVATSVQKRDLAANTPWTDAAWSSTPFLLDASTSLLTLGVNMAATTFQGLITAQAGLTVSAGAVNLDAASSIATPLRNYPIDISGFRDWAGTSSYVLAANPRRIDLTSGDATTGDVYIPENEQIVNVFVYYFSPTDTGGTFLSFDFRRTDLATGTRTAIVGKGFNNAFGAGNQTYDLGSTPDFGSLPYTTLAGQSYHLECNLPSATLTWRFYGARVVTKRLS